MVVEAVLVVEDLAVVLLPAEVPEDSSVVLLPVVPVALSVVLLRAVPEVLLALVLQLHRLSIRLTTVRSLPSALTNRCCVCVPSLN